MYLRRYSVQSIARQSLRGVHPGIGQILEGRLLALGAVHDVLTRRKLGRRQVSKRRLPGALAPYGGMNDGRFVVSGPLLILRPSAALSLTLGLVAVAELLRSRDIRSYL
jgi:hypothetical protein